MPPRPKFTLTALHQNIMMVASIIGVLFWFDNRHDPADSGYAAELKSYIFTLQTAKSSTDSTITRYDNMEELGQLTPANNIRRRVLVDESEAHQAEIVRYQGLLDGLEEFIRERGQ